MKRPASGKWRLPPFPVQVTADQIIIAKMKGRVMKVLSRLFGCCWALTVLLNAELCRADGVFLASVGNILVMSDVNEPLTSPNFDGAGYADAIRGQKPGIINYSPKESPDNNGLSYADLASSPLENADATGDSQGRSENADSPLDRYLLLVIAGGAAALVLIAGGIAQFWRRRSISNYWLFPAVRDDGEPAAPGNSAPATLIAKKQMETLPEEKINKHAHRRAA